MVFSVAYPGEAQACDPRVSCCRTPPGTGNPCGSASVASLSNTGGTSVAAGNPLHLLSGNKYQEAVDLPALRGELGLEVIRHYNSQTSGTASPGGLLGRGWRLSYDTRIRASSDRQHLQIDQADGALLSFQQSRDTPQHYLPSDRQRQGWVERTGADTTGSGGIQWRWHWPEGKRLDFNAQGQLVQIVAASGAFLSIERDPQGWPVRITDPQGRHLRFHYQRTPGTPTTHPQYRGLQAIDTPAGRIDYTYADSADPIQRANLVRAQGPQTDWRYHHEDTRHPTLLTGISQGQRRLSRYEYDAQGQAQRSQRLDEPERNVHIVRHQLPQGKQPGQVQLRNAQGQDTEIQYRVIQSQYRLTQITGAGCPDCGPSPRRYDWDEQGRLVAEHQLDGQGRIQLSQRYERDRQGRVVRQWQERAGQGKSAVQNVMTFSYADANSNEPRRIERPSVVPGKTQAIEIEYNARGQIVSVTERGWRPAVGQETAPTALQRTTTYRYADVAGVSMLTQIDGPLPNGPQQTPQDSDIIRFEYSAQTRQVLTLTQPGGAQHRFTYDLSGRLLRVINEEGFYTAWRYNPQGQLTHLARGGPGWSQPTVQVLQYDAQGRLTEAGHSQLSAQHLSAPEALAQVDSQRLQAWLEPHYRAQWKQAFDESDRLLWQADARGFLTQHHYNEQGQLLETRYSSNRFQHTQRYDGQSPFEPTRPPTPGAQRWRDDWGRVVTIDHPYSGRTWHDYNQADQLIGMQDSQGHQAQYRYDLAGRILEQTITPQQGQPSTTRWQYNGRRLIALEHATQSERYQYDPRGLRIARTVIVPRGPGQAPLTSQTRYHYDEQGHLSATTLPDGSVISYEKNGQGQIVALKRNPVQTSWLRWLAADQVLVQDLQRDLYGLAHYQTGNGVQTEWQRSTAGDLARLVHRRITAPPRQQTAHHPYTHDLLALLLGLSPAYAQTTQPTQPVQPAAPSTEPGALGLASDPQALLDYRYVWDTRGNLLLNPIRRAGSSAIEHNAYAYDQREQLLVAVRQDSSSASAQHVWRYAYDSQQRRVLMQTTSTQDDGRNGTTRLRSNDGQTDLSQRRNDASGQPTHMGQRQYQWDALGRLVQVQTRSQDQNQSLGRYGYDHRGLRNRKISAQEDTYYLYDDSRQLQAEINAQGRLQRQYVYLADQPLMVIDSADGVDLSQSQSESALSQVVQDLQRLWRYWQDSDRLTWLHLNHLGAPEAATDDTGQVIWQVRTSPFGETLSVQAEHGFSLHLRLPGQYWDAETGLHYNRARYYDPQTGEYLSPDPLHDGGTWPDGPNPYAYVAHNPLRYIDPEGLLLFAFDGTDNTDDTDDLARLGNSLSNVVRFRDAYDDGRTRYVTGVGTVHRDRDWGDINAPYADSGINRTGTRRIDRMMIYLMEEMDRETDDNKAIDIDIVGFSRGSAQARDFANQITRLTRNGRLYYNASERRTDGTVRRFSGCQRVNFRFMGLFDTVLSTNSGRNYNMAIPAQFQYVAHAVALNEYRSQPFSTVGFANQAFWNQTRINKPGDYHWGAFPLESIGASSRTPGRVRIEQGFIGAHSDIGGGYLENDLSLVALNWMVAQAQIAGVKMSTSRVPRLPTGNPVIHDPSNAILVGDPTRNTTITVRRGRTTNTYTVEDREIRINNVDTGVRQRNMRLGTPEPGGNRSMTNADTHQFIRYFDRNTRGVLNPDNLPNEIYGGERLGAGKDMNRTGTVDMAGYLNWLRQHGYVFPKDY